MSTNGRFKVTFMEESYELLGALESSLIELEEHPDDSELIASIFRSIHTIKGSAAMFGFESIAAFTHELETILDDLRGGKIPVSKELIDMTLKSRDHILLMLDSGLESSPEHDADSRSIISEMNGLLGRKEAGEPEPLEKGEGREQSGQEQTYGIQFAPHSNIFFSGTNPLLLLRELSEMGDFSIVAHPNNIPPIKKINPELCYTSWDIFLTTYEDINAIRDVFIFVEEEIDLSIKIVDRSNQALIGPEKKLGEILVKSGALKQEEMEKVLGTQKRIGEILVEKEIVSGDQINTALEEQKHLRKQKEKIQSRMAMGSVRVDADKLDELVNLVGELVTVQARLSQNAEKGNDGELSLVSEQFERLICELRDNTMSIRMLPIGTTFNRYKRLVRDLSNDLGKEIQLITEGGGTELDKTVIEKLNDPLIHLLRNSIDHGIESPEERKRKGKPARGTVKLSAEHSGATVLISIEDDGAGLQKKAIFEKAVARGLISESAVLSDEEIYELIFHPGFSMAHSVTSVSGRGVGMDVVKRQLEAFRGSISIQSAMDQFTRITLEIPLTLAIIEGMLVQVGIDFFIIPLSSVDACIEFKGYEQDSSTREKLITYRERLIPFVKLREAFDIQGDSPDIEQIVITNVKGHELGITVDQVIGGHQTVIKNLGGLYNQVEGISGATILGDGSIALILDLPKLWGIVKNTKVAVRDD